MQSTTNYGLNIVEGTDIVNPLTQFNPNFTDIDSIMKSNADASIDHATCIKTGTVHAVTRTNTGASVFRFTATGNWNLGDTMTVDGALVSVFNPDGTAPTTGCYVINTEVLAAIQGTRVTLYVASSSASNVSYDNSGSGLVASNVQNAIDELKQDIGNVVESGANANGRYIKFDDGTMICTKQIINNVAVDSPWGSLYQSSDVDLGTFAETFYSVPNVNVMNCNSDSAWISGIRNVSSTSAGTINFIRATTSVARDRLISVIAVGRWTA